MERILRKSGALLVEENEEGEILFSDVEERNTAHAGRYAEYPFAAEFAYERDGEEIHGDTDCFRLTSVGTRGKTLVKEYSSQDGAVKVTVKQIFRQGVLSQICTIKNLGAVKLCVKKLANRFAGIGGACLSDDYLGRIRIGVVRGEWGGEGQLHWESPETLGLFRATGHKTGCSGDVSSVASYTTRKFSPVVFFRDETAGTVWAVQHLPDGPYNLEISLTDAERIEGSMYKITCGAGDSEKQGFRLYLRKGAEYRCAESLFTCAKDFSSVSGMLTNYRRKYLKKHKTVPLMFNDYMNCLWCKLDEKACISLMDKAKEVGAEGYCFDDGWYRAKDANGFTGLGDWIPCDERFGGHTFAEMIGEIRSRGMVAGLWTELEVCSALSALSKYPKSWFLTNEGERIYRCGRYYLDLGNKEVREYLLGKIRALYDLGIRYIKNDYNGHPGCGVDRKNASPYAGLEQHCRQVNAFYAEVRREFPDLYLENCASGAMRADGNTMRNFNVQSISDCEEYDKIPSILNGTLLSLLPEQIGVWTYPYPRVFWEMNGEEYFTPAYVAERKDGEETIFNLINGMTGTMYLSGKIDVCDEENLSLIRQGVSLYKELREFIGASYPVYPLGLARLTDKNSFAAQGLKNGKKILLAVWRRESGSDEVFIPVKNVTSVKEIFPCRSFAVKRERGGIRVGFTKKNQAVLLELTLSGRME